MVRQEGRILEDSEICFHTAGQTARELFFYPLCAGYYHCGCSYRVERRSYDSFLVMYLTEGRGFVEHEGREVPVEVGEAALVDCYRPHVYGTHHGCRMYWLHFDGALARGYSELCTRSGPVIRPRNPLTCRRQMEKLFGLLRREGKVSEAELSLWITGLLTELIQSATAGQSSQNRASGAVDETLGFIAENVARPLTLQDMAENVALSPCYFSRLFKAETGCSPHEYLIRARVDRAKYLLKSTRLPLKEIAGACGFGSECSFSTTFRRISGVTPMGYRREENEDPRSAKR